MIRALVLAIACALFSGCGGELPEPQPRPDAGLGGLPSGCAEARDCK